MLARSITAEDKKEMVEEIAIVTKKIVTTQRQLLCFLLFCLPRSLGASSAFKSETLCFHKNKFGRRIGRLTDTFVRKEVAADRVNLAA